MSDHGSSSQQAEQLHAKNPACDVCREKKVRCGREKPECDNCKIWKTACTYSERLKRENDQTRLAQRFEEVHDRLDRIEQAVQRLTTAVERIAVPSPSLSGASPSGGSSIPSSSHWLSRGIEEALSPNRQPQAKAGTLVADKHGELHYLGANSLPSITSEAESIAQQRIRLKLPSLSGRSRTEASNVLRRLSGLKVDATSAVPEYEWENINVSGGRWWFPEREIAVQISTEYFNRANHIYPIFRQETYMQKLHAMYDRPEEMSEIGWLTCFNNVLLFGLYAVTKARIEGCRELAQRLVNNIWIALTDTKLFLTPKFINIQALMMSAVVAQETSRPGLCWTLMCQACRLAQAIGLHRRSDPSRFNGEADYEERKWVFWNLYVMDKSLAMTLGRSACIPDYDIDVELPKRTDEICWPLFLACVSLAKIQSRTYERLYSAAASACSSEERRTIIMSLDGELRQWSEETEKLNIDCASDILEEKYVELELRFNYYNSLLLIHRVDQGNGTQSEEICLDSARKAIASIQTAVSEDADLADSGLVLWLYLYYPFTPFFTLFTHIVRNPQGPTARNDLELIRYIRDHLARMSESHAGADRLSRVASGFVRMAETLLGENGSHVDRPSIGKRKRGPRRPPKLQRTPSEAISDEHIDLDFLRPLQQQPQQQPSPAAQELHQPTQPEQAAGVTPLSDQLDWMSPGPSNEAVACAQYRAGAGSSAPAPAPPPPPVLSVPDQIFLGSGQGPFDFDWVLWDQSIEPDFGAIPEAFMLNNAAGTDWFPRTQS